MDEVETEICSTISTSGPLAEKSLFTFLVCWETHPLSIYLISCLILEDFFMQKRFKETHSHIEALSILHACSTSGLKFTKSELTERSQSINASILVKCITIKLAWKSILESIVVCTLSFARYARNLSYTRTFIQNI